jgi:hypothetical protein
LAARGAPLLVDGRRRPAGGRLNASRSHLVLLMGTLEVVMVRDGVRGGRRWNGRGVGSRRQPVMTVL